MIEQILKRFLFVATSFTHTDEQSIWDTCVILC